MSSNAAAARLPALVATKVQVPQPPRGLVNRPDLIARLSSGEARKLVLVCAPAGWSKTSLLSEWSASASGERAFAWVSLDPGDDDPVRFWSYVIEALRSFDPALGRESSAALPSAGAGLVDTVLPPLLNELAQVARPLVLVLDDYQSIRHELIHASVAYLLRHLPHTVQVALATRADPPLPVASLRAAGDLVEIRAADLRFGTPEASALLNGSLGLALDPADVELLRLRTEGWAAGLQLAGLSAESHEDKHAFVEAFAGDDRQIGDYLHEVLADQPAPLREFLLDTSILERLTAPLCDAVTEAGNSAALLEVAERSNLFLVALDSRREWYRYHHLFRDLLRHELARSRGGNVASLHHRAASWYLAEGAADEAIAHTIDAGNFDEARGLIVSHMRDAVVLGRYETVARWIDALPPALARADPALCSRRAWCALHLGKLDDAASWRRGFSADDGAAAAEFDAGFAARRGDVGQALTAAQAVAAAFADDRSPARAFSELNLGEVLFYAGRFAEAAECFERALGRLENVEPSPNIGQALLHGHVYLAVVRAELGELDLAERSLVEAERQIRDTNHGERHPNAVFLQVARGKLLALSGDVASSEQSLGRADELQRSVGWPLDRAYTLVQLAGAKRRLRKHDEARMLAREARKVLKTCPDPGMLGELLVQTERTLQLGAPSASATATWVDVDLSERELSVLRLLTSDLSQREIGAELYVSFNTVKSHTRAIFRKLGVSTRAGAVARARQLDLI